MSISNRKVVIVGAGHVGSHVGYALISQSLADEIVYIDSDHAKAVAQAFDLTDATNYLPVRTKVTAGDYSDAKDAQIMIISAGPLPTGNQTRMDTLGQTIAILKDVTKSIKKSGFDGIIVNISNPADVITHYIQHTLNWAPERIFSTSTTLDSARLRRAIAQEIGIDQKSITAYALGEHGESQMVAWSAVTIAGKPLSQWREEYPDTFGRLDLDALADAGREGGWTILRGKQCTALLPQRSFAPSSTTRTAFFRFLFYWTANTVSTMCTLACPLSWVATASQRSLSCTSPRRSRRSLTHPARP
jgi:L-lactate dehydrogenase